MEKSGTAEREGRLWGARPLAWAEQETQEAARFALAIERLGVAAGQRVLELGCGTGVFLRQAADRGARVFGLDASEPLIEIARRRVPEADLRVGDLQFLPYEDDSFDLVAGFNSFAFAADMTDALREAGRVARPGARVLIQVWGRPERCDLTAIRRALGPLRPGRTGPASAPLWAPGVLEELASAIGLTPDAAFDASFTLEYPDERTMLRRLLSAGAAVEAIETSGEGAVRAAVVDALAPHRTAAGGYRLRNEWRYLIARA